MGYLGLARRLGLAGGYVLSRPPSLARCLGLAPWEDHDVLGTWDEWYLKDTFDL